MSLILVHVQLTFVIGVTPHKGGEGCGARLSDSCTGVLHVIAGGESGLVHCPRQSVCYKADLEKIYAIGFFIFSYGRFVNLN